MSRERALAIVNRAAGKGAGARLMPRIARDLAAAGVDADVVATPAPGEAGRLASHAGEDGYTRVIAVGGDGTANEVANGLVDTDVALALYPIGSGNDFARALGYPRRRKQIAPFIDRAQRRRIDVGEANGRVFLNSVGVGIDGDVAERVLAVSRVVGPALGYFLGSLASIATFEPPKMRIRVDGQAREGPHMMVLAANGTYFGSGMRVAPHAKLDDGMFDVIVGGDLSRWQSIVSLTKIYRGAHIDGKTIFQFRASSVDVDFDGPLPGQLDGEFTRVSGLRMRVRPRALTV